MQIPERINGKWMSTLDDVAILDVERILHLDFREQDLLEKNKRGTRYRMLEGPAILVDAWMRWQAVSNETRRRGLLVHRRA